MIRRTDYRSRRARPSALAFLILAGFAGSASAGLAGFAGSASAGDRLNF
jgi:hypothetical protein